MLNRLLSLETEYNDSVFLWGARQVGKTTLLDELYPDCRRYDLLRAKDYNRLLRRPELLGEELDSLGPEDTVIIDEVQKIPQLLDEVHSLIHRRSIRFILSGSSPRKLKRYGANLLGGRAVRKVLYPLVSAEVPDFDIVRAVNNGMIPRHYLVENPWERFRAYINVYLNEEIREEALSRNLQSFSKFLEVAAQSDGEMLVYKNVAQDCGIDYRTVKSYFEILQDTLIGYLIPGFTHSRKRSAVQSPKFYYYDVGITNFLLGRRDMRPGTELFGHSFEHLIIQELVAWLGYHQSDEKLTYWHTTSGYEVDAIIGEGRVAIEVKSCEEVKSRHLRGLKAFGEEFPDCRLIVVSLDAYRRRMNGVEIIPAMEFLSDLWAGKIL
ncbi:MAG: ATP-binding protein [Bacteroidales bacterium]|nr:ATP-binding protein [Bacteroidales bacterium]